MTHRRLRDWTDPVEIRDRILVLRDKANRICVYNGTLDATVLDEKQLQIMVRKGRALGVDTFPAGVLNSISRSIDFLERRLSRLDASPAYAARLLRPRREPWAA